MLCSQCRKGLEEFKDAFKLPGPSTAYGGSHHDTVLELREAVDCQVCKIVLHDLEGSGEIDSPSIQDATFQWNLEVGKTVKFSLNVLHERRWTHRWTFCLVPDADVGHLCSQELTSASTASDDSWNCALQWILRCLKDHPRCKSNVQRNVLPSRILDVGVLGQGSIKLVERKDAELGAYVTLSHRWGDSEFLQLNMNSLPTLKDGFSISILPKTFQDAVFVAQRLAVRYLWIDSICILQDDQEDWTREAAVMHEVYQNSFLNISATGAFDSSEGLFFDRDPKIFSPVRITTQFSDEGPTMYQVLYQSYVDHHISKTALNRRGWVLQERLLAPRVLHFGRQQLLWECHVNCSSEQYSELLPPALKPRLLKITDLYRESLNDQDNTALEFKLRDGLWNNIMEEYSALHLTHAGDKLVALSGIAKHIQSVFRDDYLAGVWRKQMIDSLLWMVLWDQDDGRPARLVNYIAPTWSWASIQAAVHAVFIRVSASFLPTCRILDAKVTLTTPDPTGQVSDGWLLLQCRLKKLSLIYSGRHPRLSNSNRDRYGWIIQGLRAKDGRRLPKQMAIYMDLPRDYAAAEDLYLISLRASQILIQGLVLECSTSRKAEGCYVRVGMFWCKRTVDKDAVVRAEEDEDDFDFWGFVTAVDEAEASYPCKEYDRKLKHTIVLL